MQQRFRFAPVTLALVIAVVLVTSGGPMAGFAHAGENKEVKLVVVTGLDGRQVITAVPPHAKIWRNKPNKPKKITWKTGNNSPYDEIYWELRYDPGKGGGSENYFGDVDIACGETAKKVQPDKKPDFPYAQWPYSVTVYACHDGVKAQEIATIDPRIIWQD